MEIKKPGIEQESNNSKVQDPVNPESGYVPIVECLKGNRYDIGGEIGVVTHEQLVSFLKNNPDIKLNILELLNILEGYNNIPENPDSAPLMFKENIFYNPKEGGLRAQLLSCFSKKGNKKIKKSLDNYNKVINM